MPHAPQTTFLGYSCTGEKHRKAGIPNQDAWLAKTYSFGSLVVAADGMGSRPHSDIGSQAACKAVAKALQFMHRNGCTAFDKEQLAMLIHTMWTPLVSKQYDYRECCTTCLFAVQLRDRRLVTGQLGDGIILFRRESECINLSPAREDFINKTVALGSTWDLDDWTLREFDLVDADQGILLATDGVSDDLKPETYSGFVDYMFRLIDEPPQVRWRKLKQELEDWPTPFSYDDKTIVAARFKMEDAS